RIEPHGDDDADQGTVKGHAAAPDGEYLERVLQVVAEVVEQNVAETPAQNDAQSDVEQQVAHFRGLPAGARPPGAVHSQEPAGDEADEIHEPVPVDLQRSDGE